jgi:hypothetical protein
MRSRSAVVFDDVTVVPMDMERRLEHQAVVVQDDRISWIGPTREAPPSEGARRIDGRGKYLMPGLADMHVHAWTEQDLLLFVAHGVTTVRNMAGRPCHLAWKQQVARGELLGPRISTAGQIIGGRPPRRTWVMSVSTADDCIQAVMATKAAGYEAIKIYDELTVYAYRWLVDAAAEQDLPVWGHVPFQVGLQGALHARQRSMEHMHGYLEALSHGARPLTDPLEARALILREGLSAPESRFQELAEMTREHGVWNCLTLLVRKRWTQDPVRFADHPVLRYLPPVHAEMWRQRQFSQGHPPASEGRPLWDLYLRMTKALSDAGAGLLAGTDAGLPTVAPGLSLHEELDALTEAGLTPFQALRAATSEAARFMGAQGEWGGIAEGARADLLLVDADPLANVANASKIAGVMLAGRWLPASTLQEKLDELAAQQQAAASKRWLADQRAKPAAPARCHRYRVQWAGLETGAEEVTISPRADGGFLLHSEADIGMLVGWGAGRYSTELEVDADGVDRAARFVATGADGRDQIELSSHDGRIQIQRTDELGHQHTEAVEASSQTLLGRPLILLFVQLGRRLVDMEVGDAHTLRLVGPGPTGDGTVMGSGLRVQREPDRTEDPPASRRYSFQLDRANACVDGELVCDGGGWPLEVVLSTTMAGANTPLKKVSRGAAVQVTRVV